MERQSLSKASDIKTITPVLEVVFYFSGRILGSWAGPSFRQVGRRLIFVWAGLSLSMLAGPGFRHDPVDIPIE